MKDTPPRQIYRIEYVTSLRNFKKNKKKRVIGVVCLCYDSVTNVKIEH